MVFFQKSFTFHALFTVMSIQSSSVTRRRRHARLMRPPVRLSGLGETSEHAQRRRAHGRVARDQLLPTRAREVPAHATATEEAWG